MDFMEIKKRLKFLSVITFIISSFLFVFSYFIDVLLSRKHQVIYGIYVSLPMLLCVFILMFYIFQKIIFKKIKINFIYLLFALSPIIIFIKVIMFQS